MATGSRARARSAGINFADVLMAAGKYQVKPPTPYVGGAELSGTVLALGDAVRDFAVGDRVVALPTLGGAFAGECVVDTSALFKARGGRVARCTVGSDSFP